MYYCSNTAYCSQSCVQSTTNSEVIRQILEVTEKFLVFDRVSLNKTIQSVPMKVCIHTRKEPNKEAANTW